MGVGVLFPQLLPALPPGAPHSAGFRDPVRAASSSSASGGQVACSGLLGPYSWSHPPQQVGSGSPHPTFCAPAPLLGAQWPPACSPSPSITWSPESLSNDCGPELRVLGCRQRRVMERVCYEVRQCRLPEPWAGGHWCDFSCGHGPWGVWVSITRNQGWWRQSLSWPVLTAPRERLGSWTSWLRCGPWAQQHWTAGAPDSPGLLCPGLGNRDTQECVAGAHSAPPPALLFFGHPGLPP